MQARPSRAAGTRASSSALKRTLRHQQSPSNEPVAAGTQPFGPPHSGHVVSRPGGAWPQGTAAAAGEAGEGVFTGQILRRTSAATGVPRTRCHGHLVRRCFSAASKAALGFTRLVSFWYWSVLATERRSFTRQGRPVDLARAVCRGGCYDYVTELRIAPESGADAKGGNE